MGFGFERDNGKERQVIGFGGDPLKMPHFGGVIIGDNCDIDLLQQYVLEQLNQLFLKTMLWSMTMFI